MKRKGSCCASSFLAWFFFHFHLISPPHFCPWYSLRQMQQQRERVRSSSSSGRALYKIIIAGSQGLFRGKSLTGGTHTKKIGPCIQARRMLLAARATGARSLPARNLPAEIENGKHVLARKWKTRPKGRLQERICSRSNYIMKQSAHSWYQRLRSQWLFGK
jgi:hypothetical protein